MSLTSLRNWRPQHLLGAWVAYWAALVAVKLGPAISAIITATSAGTGKGNVAAGIGDGGVTLKVVNAGSVLYDGSVPATSLALWIAGPPLLLWLAWLATRPRRDARLAELRAAEPDIHVIVDREKVRDRDAR